MQRLPLILWLYASIIGFFLSCESSTVSSERMKEVNQPFEYQVPDSITGFEKALEIRRLIADTLDAGITSDSLCLNFASISFDKFLVEPFLTKFANNKGAGTCGLAGALLAKTLNLHGIEAYTYNYGFEEPRITHVVVLAKTDNAWTLHDPFFNYSITDTLGNPKDFLRLLRELSDGDDSNVSFTSDTVIREFHFDLDTRISDFASDQCVDHIKSININSNPDSILFHQNVCYLCGLDNTNCPELNFFNQMSRQVNNLNRSENAIFGLLFQINGLWGPNPQALQEQIDDIIKN